MSLFMSERPQSRDHHRARRGHRPPKYGDDAVLVTIEGEEEEGVAPLVTWQERLAHIYEEYHLRHVIPLVMLIVYASCTAFFLYLVESGHEQRAWTSHLSKMGRNRANTIHKLMNLWGKEYLLDNSRIMNVSEEIVREFEMAMELHDPPPIAWDMCGALFYVATIFTTIGYGSIAPRTNYGRLLTICCSIVGIPLVLAILNDYGKLFCKVATYWWQRTRRRLRPPSSAGKSTVSWSEHDSQTMPLLLALVICFTWVFLCAALFTRWETKWGYFSAVYFFYVSLTTIGLGDIVPAHPRLLLLNFWAIFIGLALVSMLINVIQQSIERWLYAIMRLMQEEFDLALAHGDDVERTEILEKVMQRQPWYVRALTDAPATQERIEQLTHTPINTLANSIYTQTTTTAMETSTPPPAEPTPRSADLGHNFASIISLMSSASGQFVQADEELNSVAERRDMATSPVGSIDLVDEVEVEVDSPQRKASTISSSDMMALTLNWETVLSFINALTVDEREALVGECCPQWVERRFEGDEGEEEEEGSLGSSSSMTTTSDGVVLPAITLTPVDEWPSKMIDAAVDTEGASIEDRDVQTERASKSRTQPSLETSCSTQHMIDSVTPFPSSSTQTSSHLNAVDASYCVDSVVRTIFGHSLAEMGYDRAAMEEGEEGAQSPRGTQSTEVSKPRDFAAQTSFETKDQLQCSIDHPTGAKVSSESTQTSLDDPSPDILESDAHEQDISSPPRLLADVKPCLQSTVTQTSFESKHREHSFESTVTQTSFDHEVTMENSAMVVPQTSMTDVQLMDNETQTEVEPQLVATSDSGSTPSTAAMVMQTSIEGGDTSDENSVTYFDAEAARTSAEEGSDATSTTAHDEPPIVQMVDRINQTSVEDMVDVPEGEKESMAVCTQTEYDVNEDWEDDETEYAQCGVQTTTVARGEDGTQTCRTTVVDACAQHELVVWLNTHSQTEGDKQQDRVEPPPQKELASTSMQTGESSDVTPPATPRRGMMGMGMLARAASTFMSNRREIAQNTHDGSAQTDAFIDKTSIIVQTDDSYLRIARRLHSLRTKKTSSLSTLSVVSVRPGDRKFTPVLRKNAANLAMVAEHDGRDVPHIANLRYNRKSLRKGSGGIQPVKAKFEGEETEHKES